MKRPELDRRMSARAQAIDVAILDLLEALEDLWEDASVLEELGKAQGATDPVQEALMLERYWQGQKRLLSVLQEARSSVVGARHAVARLTER